MRDALIAEFTVEQMLNPIFGNGDMKSKLINFLLLIFAIFVVDNRFYAQQSGLSVRNDQMVLLTDRNLYITGEEIRFSVFPVINNIYGENKASRIVYVEVITPDGKKITGAKYPLENGKSRGCLSIPANVLTGEYYVRAYTRYMRNAGPANYPYTGLKLINPAGNNVLTGNGYSRADSMDRLMPGQVIQEITALKTGKNVYTTREKVDLFVQTGRLKELGSTGWCLTVVPDGTLEGANGPVFANTRYGSFNQDSTGIQFYPDTRGISISGKLVDAETGKSVYDRVVTLSIIGDKDFSAYRTGRNGQFYFSLPDYYGKRDIFLCSGEISGKTTRILIDNDFCTNPVKLPSSGFILTEKERQAGLTLAVNAQVASNFQNGGEADSNSVSGLIKSFYDEPSVTLFLDKYIQLPTLEDYFNELPMLVKIRERQGRKYFKFVSSDAEMMNYDPLILVDWVVVMETNKILTLSPQEISRVEIINKPYIKGNLMYGGILSIISKQGDFAGIDLPASGVFINYAFLSDECRDTRYDSVVARLPDSRNSLFWEPDMVMDSGDSQIISFSTSDTPGDYRIVLRGVGMNGLLYRQAISFKVE
jgi:hypothetical protein